MINFDNSSVRRQERLLSEESSLDLLRVSEYGILSFVETRCGAVAAYGIPLNYVLNEDYIYFHCAPDGYKMSCLDISNEVSFTIVGRTEVISEKFTTAYQSVVVRGQLERGLADTERMNALKMLLQKYSPNDMERGLKYAEKSFHRTEILRLKITSISAKAKQIGR
ncbi:pyridoxamine 5'-phosphate oxidase family protein [Parabacteroides provencensis]|uniref:pyridoxamine 5'-phosphate oxidase family protein n=1 Tax=Parabacteroides provencensis TaxID=1944636 RepID=UPI0018EBA26E|nr:pyridoxamine 5'-phosphate oxidase family protein [Parabacteroides provencensis]